MKKKILSIIVFFMVFFQISCQKKWRQWKGEQESYVRKTFIDRASFKLIRTQSPSEATLVFQAAENLSCSVSYYAKDEQQSPPKNNPQLTEPCQVVQPSNPGGGFMYSAKVLNLNGATLYGFEIEMKRTTLVDFLFSKSKDFIDKLGIEEVSFGVLGAPFDLDIDSSEFGLPTDKILVTRINIPTKTLEAHEKKLDKSFSKTDLISALSPSNIGECSKANYTTILSRSDSLAKDLLNFSLKGFYETSTTTHPLYSNIFRSENLSVSSSQNSATFNVDFQGSGPLTFSLDEVPPTIKNFTLNSSSQIELNKALLLQIDQIGSLSRRQDLTLNWSFSANLGVLPIFTIFTIGLPDKSSSLTCIFDGTKQSAVISQKFLENLPNDNLVISGVTVSYQLARKKNSLEAKGLSLLTQSLDWRAASVKFDP